MATISVSDFSLFINRQIQSQEQIEIYLWKIEVLIAVAMIVNDFYELPTKILHHYFSIAGDLIEEAAKANQVSLSDLLKQEK